MTASPTVTVSIVSYNTRDLLDALLLRLTAQTEGRLRGVIVIDNASSDGSAEMVSQRYPDVQLVRNAYNRGFGAAHNQVLQTVQSTYWLVLNPDSVLEPKDLDAMVDFMDQHPRCGIAGCSLRGFDGAFQGSAGQFPFGTALLGWLFNLESLGIRSNLHRNDQEFYARGKRVDWVSGACMIVRSDVARQIGGFDERYFLYFEDIDLCYRARLKGYSTLLINDVIIRHLGGASTRDPRFDQWLGSLVGAVRFYEQHRGPGPAYVIRGLALTAVSARIVAYGAIGSWEAMRTYCRVLRGLIQPARAHPQIG